MQLLRAVKRVLGSRPVSHAARSVRLTCRVHNAPLAAIIQFWVSRHLALKGRQAT